MAARGCRRLAVGLCGPDNRAFVWSPGPCGLVIGHEGSGKSTLMEHLGSLGDSDDPGAPCIWGLATGCRQPAEEFLKLPPAG